MDLRASYLGLELRTPLVASPSPLTGTVGGLRQLEDAGVSAVVLRSLFEEEILIESFEFDDALERWAASFGEAPHYVRELYEQRTRPEQYLELIADAKRSLSVPVIASLNVNTPGPWLDQLALIEQAGADALELTLFTLAADPAISAQILEARYREIVASVRRTLRIPLAVKLAPFLTALSHTADELVQTGADGIVLFHRGYQPYLDLESLEVEPRMLQSASPQVLLPLRWIAILRGRVKASLAATGGVHTVHDTLRLLMAGADAVMMSSALVENGPEHLRTLEKGIVDWLTKQGYASLGQLVGSASQEAIVDRAAWERVSYVKMLHSFFGTPPD